MSPAEELREAAKLLYAEAEAEGKQPAFTRLVGKALEDAAAEYDSHQPETQEFIASCGGFRADTRVALAREILLLPRPSGVRASMQTRSVGGDGPPGDGDAIDEPGHGRPDQRHRAGEPEPQ